MVLKNRHDPDEDRDRLYELEERIEELEERIERLEEDSSEEES